MAFIDFVELRNFKSPVKNQFVNVLGYSTPGDGGGGDFYFDTSLTSPDNDGTIIKPLNSTNAGRWKRLYNGNISVKWFGATGDGSHNDTQCIQNALDTLETVFFPRGTYRITHGLFCGSEKKPQSGAPIIMDAYAIIQPTGSGYTALSIFPRPLSSGWTIYVDTTAEYLTIGTGLPALNGIYFYDCTALQISYLRVNGMYGFGLKFGIMFDTQINTICVERCGSDDDYALSFLTRQTTPEIFDGVNETMISRLQVERAYKKAIYVHPRTLNMHIGVCHSERIFADSKSDTWDFSGANCTFDNLRFTTKKNYVKNNSADGTGRLLLGGDSCIYNGIRAEDDPDPDGGIVEVYLRVTAGSAIINNLGAGHLDFLEGHNSMVIINNIGISPSTSGPARKVRMLDIPGTIVRGGNIDELTIAQSGGQLTDVSSHIFTIENVKIRSIVNSERAAGCFLRNCVVTNYNSDINRFIADSCLFLEDAKFYKSAYFEIRHCTFKQDVTFNFDDDNNLVRYGKIFFSHVAGNMNVDRYRKISGLLNTGTTVEGLVDDVFNMPPSAGNWQAGDRHYPIIPVKNTPKSWVIDSTYKFMSDGDL